MSNGGQITILGENKKGLEFYTVFVKPRNIYKISQSKINNHRSLSKLFTEISSQSHHIRV